jgi:hypothetical protein
MRVGKVRMQIVGFPYLSFLVAIAHNKSIEIKRLVFTRHYKK